MMKGWIEVRVWADDKPTDSLVAISIAAISQVSDMGSHGNVKRVDAGDLDTVENYAVLLAKIKDAS